MSDGSQPADLPLPDAATAAEQFSSKYGQLMALTGRLSADQMAALRELDGTLAMAEHVLAGTPVGAGAHSTICGFILNAYAAGRAQGAPAERERIYASDNFPGDGSVGPDEIPEAYRHLDAAYWHRRWLWTMNRLDEAPTAWDVQAAARAERERIRQLAGEHKAVTRVRHKCLDPDCPQFVAGEPFADLLAGDAPATPTTEEKQ